MDVLLDVVLLVLDVLVQTVGVVVLLGGALLLIVLVWDIMQPEMNDSPFVPVDRSIVKAGEMARGMGFKTRFDYSTFGGQVKERVGHCYMLTAKAMLYDDINSDNMPMPVAVVHGSWHGPESESRIDHAIVLLDTGDVWEPVTAGIYDYETFKSYTRWHRHQIYTEQDARGLMRSTGTYGPWSGHA